MRRRLPSGIAGLVLGALLLVGGAAPVGAAAAKAPSPDSPEFPVYVMTRIDDISRGQKSHGVMEMHVQTRHWTRTMEMESWSLGKDYSLIKILKPLKEAGTATLKAKQDLFTYLNKTGSTIKISGGMMGSSWMGSHFTNDDLVRETRMSEDFVIRKDPDGTEAGTKAYRFTLTPRPNAPVVWGKIEYAVRQSDLSALRATYYDEDGKKVREQIFSDFQVVDGDVRPMKLTMRPLDGSNEFTEVRTKKLEFNIDIDTGFFSLMKLKAR